MSFLTSHLRARNWWYEIVALDVRLLLGGALCPVIHHTGLHMIVVLMIMLAFLITTRDINPYLNKGHQAILNIILFAELSTVLFGLIVKAEFLTSAAESAMSAVMLAIALLVGRAG